MSNHPIRRPDVQDDVERWTTEMLSANGGHGRICIEFDFKDWQPVSYRPVMEGRRRPLTGDGKRVK